MLKRAAEMVLGRGLGPWFERRARGKVAVLAYHNIIPDGQSPGADHSLHIPRSQFAAQLDVLCESHHIVALDEVVDGFDEGGFEDDRPWAVLTFDDAYRGAMTCGLREVERRGLPATVFVSPGLLGVDGFWWDRIAWPESGVADSESKVPARAELLEDLRGDRDHILERARREGWLCAPPPEYASPVTPSELRTAGKQPGLTFGCHGWSHRNLARLGYSDCTRELSRSLAWLNEEVAEATRSVLAYPYGRWCQQTVEAAKTTGFRAAFQIEDGLLSLAHGDRFRVPRMNVPAGVSLDGFRLRAFGVVP